MSHFGYTVAIAFSDIKLKARKIIENRDLLIKEGYISANSQEAKYFQTFILFEKRNHFVYLDGNNNKKVINKSINNPKTWMNSYMSTGFNLMRGGAWLTFYLHHMFK